MYTRLWLLSLPNIIIILLSAIIIITYYYDYYYYDSFDFKREIFKTVMHMTVWAFFV